MYVTPYSLQCHDHVDSIMTCRSTISWSYCLLVVDAKTTSLATNEKALWYERATDFKAVQHLSEQNAPVTICPKTNTFQAMGGWNSTQLCHCKDINTSIIDKTPTHALFNQHCISLACWFY